MTRCVRLALSALFLPFPHSDATEFEYLHALSDTRYDRPEAAEISRPFPVYSGLPDGYENWVAAHPACFHDGGSPCPLMAARSRYLTFRDEMPPGTDRGYFFFTL